MSLILGTVEVKGYDMKVSAVLPLAGEDLSGQSSYATQAETGDKPKKLNVKLQIKYDDVVDLRQLVTLAEAKNTAGERETYNVINETAQAMSIRQARFQGDLMVKEDETLKLWLVDFKLIEVKSIAELKEARQEAQAVTDQAPEGETVETVTNGTSTETATPESEQLSTFENVLAWVDKQIGPENEA